MSIIDDFIKLAGIFNITIEQPELDRIAKEHNEGKFAEVEDRDLDLRNSIQGDPKFEGVPQDVFDQARESGGSIIKRPNGTYYVTGTGAGNFQPGSVNLGTPSQQPTIGEISRTGIQGFQDIRDNVMGRFDELQSTVIPGFEQREQSILGNFNNLQSGLNAQAQDRTSTGMNLINQLLADVQSGFGTLRGDLLGALEGSGAQERIDINETFDNLGDATQAGLISSGLSGSTILPSLQADVARQRTGAQGRLDERLRQQELGAISSTGFGALNAQQNLGQFGAGLFSNLSGDALNLAKGLGLAGTALETDLSGQTLDAQERIGSFGIGLDAATLADLTNAGVNFGQLPFGFDMTLTGQENATTLSQMANSGVGLSGQLVQFLQSTLQPETPEQPGTFESLLPGLISGGSSIAATKIFVGCVDGDAILKMPDRPRMLKDIEIGDKVLNSRGDYVEVVATDFGRPHNERHDEYVELSCGTYSIIATSDHHIGGKAAGEWHTGEKMEFYDDKKCLLESVKKVGPVLCGDIRLADGSDYIANGFVVTSVLERSDVSAPDLTAVRQAVAA